MVQGLVNRRSQLGFSYLVVLFLVAVSSTIALRGLQYGQLQIRREREEELLYVGGAFREAIRTYYEGSPGTFKEYPPSLDALLLDSRTSTKRRPLRRIYRDPLTGSDRWGLVLTEDGKVKGIYSLSTASPIKIGSFDSGMEHFSSAKSYQGWTFVYAVR